MFHQHILVSVLMIKTLDNSGEYGVIYGQTAYLDMQGSIFIYNFGISSGVCYLVLGECEIKGATIQCKTVLIFIKYDRQ
jgi:hypothetical protein